MVQNGGYLFGYVCDKSKKTLSLTFKKRKQIETIVSITNIVHIVQVPSTIWKISAQAKRSCTRIERRLYPSGCFVDCLFCIDLGSMVSIHIRSYGWKAKYTIRSESISAHWINWTILSDESSSAQNSSVTNKRTNHCWTKILIVVLFRTFSDSVKMIFKHWKIFMRTIHQHNHSFRIMMNKTLPLSYWMWTQRQCGWCHRQVFTN